MNESGTLKITHKARVKFSIGNYMDTVDCDVVPMSACHLLLGRPWQFDLDATHGGRSNNYSFVHKGVHHVLKPMLESTIKAEVFAYVKVKKNAENIPKPRTALLQEGEDDVNISTCKKPIERPIQFHSISNIVNTSAKGTANNFAEVIIKPKVALALERENNKVSEKNCNVSEIAKAALNKSYTQFGKKDDVTVVAGIITHENL